MKKLRKIICSALCFCMIFSAVPTVMAEGSETVKIGSAEELADFAGRIAAGETALCAELTKDIELSEISWTPMGTYSSPYEGVFDGNGYSILNISVSEDADYPGLFGKISKAQIKDLTIVANISVARGVGAVAAEAENSTISNVVVNGVVMSTNAYVGGLIGTARNCDIENCTNNALVSGKYSVGGIAGQFTGLNIKYCVNKGNVKATSSVGTGSVSSVGGLVGWMRNSSAGNYSEIAYCYNTGAVSGSCVYLGGLLGFVTGNTLTVHNCYSTGSVTSTRSTEAYVGGFVGYTAQSGSARYVFNYSSGRVTASCSDSKVGGFGGTVTAISETRYNYSLDSAADSVIGNTLNIPGNAVYISSFEREHDLVAELSGVTRKFSGIVYISEFVNDKNDVNNGLPVQAWQICGTDHKYYESVTAPGCETNGFTSHTCKNCGHVYIDTETAATGHDWDEGTVSKESTCYSEGEMVYTCGNCGDTKSEPIGKAEHKIDPQKSVVTKPTCTEKGFTTYYCSEEECDYSYVDDYTDPEGHEYEEEPSEIVEPGCTVEGSKTYYCKKCDADTEGHAKVEIIPAIGHDFVDGVCSREGCGTLQSEFYYMLHINILPEDAQEVVFEFKNAQDDTTLVADDEGYYLLEKGTEYKYSVSAEHFQLLEGSFDDIDLRWVKEETEEGMVGRYIMNITMIPDFNTVYFKGSNVQIVVNDETVESTDVNYGDNLEFGVKAAENYWVADIKAMAEIAVECDDTWTGKVSSGLKGEGTEGSPFIITKCAELAYIAQEVNYGETFEGKYFRLDANLDLDNIPWEPIGKEKGIKSYVFSGNFDGNGHVIRNLNVTSTESGVPGGGLFGTLSKAVVKDLGIAAASVSAVYRGGILAALVTDSSVVDGCWATGKLDVQGNYAGGITGVVNKDCAITNCWNGASVTNSAGMGAGGIAGYAYTDVKISDCWNIGDINGAGNYGRIGGIVGYLYQNCSLERCYNSGNINFTGTFSNNNETSNIYGTGGIAGIAVSITGKDVIIKSCYNSGSVIAAAGRAGGVVGNLVSRQATGYTELSGSYNCGFVKVYDNNSFAGGIAGRVYGASTLSMLVEGCYNSGTVEGNRSGAAAGCIIKSSVNNCFALEGTAEALIYSITDTDDATVSFKNAEYMQTGEYIIELGSETDFADDMYDENGGFPILSWQYERPDIYGEYQEIQLQYDSESDKYTLAEVIRPVTVRISARTFVSEKNITFDVQPSGQVSDTLNISVWNSDGNIVRPESGTINVFKLKVGESYTYRVDAVDFETVEGILDVTDESGYLVSIRMEETIPSYKLTFETNSKYASIFDASDDNEIFGSERVSENGKFGFYIVPDDGYEIVSVRMANKSSALDVWDGKSVDTSWYKENLTEYTITTAAEFAGVSALVKSGVDFKGVALHLDSDLDMTAGDFDPIGYISGSKQITTNGSYSSYLTGVPFRGTFNGGSHTVNINISENSSVHSGYGKMYLGLFGYIDHAVIENITVTGSVTGSTYIAGITGIANHSELKNCINMASISATGGSSSGVAAVLRGNCTVKNCYNGGYITGLYSVAGIAQITYSSFMTEFDDDYQTGTSKLIGCQNAGFIVATSNSHGIGAAGIISQGTSVYLESCANTGDIFSSGSWNGGLSSYSVDAVNCYNAGNIYCTKTSGSIYSGSNYVGGLMGQASYSGTVQNCYNAGSIYYTDGGSGYTGSIAGTMTQGTPNNYINNYWLTGTASEAIYSGTMSYNYTERQIKEVNTDELKELYNSLGDDAWKKDLTGINNGYPVLRNTPDLSSACILDKLSRDEYSINAVTSDATIYVTLAKTADSVSIECESLNLKQGETYALSADIAGEDSEIWTLEWSSSDSDVAVVTGNGTVKAVGAGTAEIKASAGSVYDKCIVNVTAAETYTVTFTGGEGAEGETVVLEGKLKGEEIILPENTFSKPSCSFAGWNDGEKTYNENDMFIVPEKDVTFTAVWESYLTGKKVTTYSVSEALSVEYISGVENGYTTQGTVKFKVNDSNNNGYTPVVFCTVDNVTNVLSADSDGIYTIENPNGEISVSVYILGDSNLDGKVNAADALKLLGWDTSASVTEVVKKCSDVNFDNKYNAADALKILKFSTGVIDKL